jgi:hypothetical protein
VEFGVACNSPELEGMPRVEGERGRAEMAKQEREKRFVRKLKQIESEVSKSGRWNFFK